MDRLRIAVALPHLGVYGGIRRFLELGRVWTDRGHEVALATPVGPDEAPWLPFSGRILTIPSLASERWDVLLSPEPALFDRAEAPGALRVFYAVLEKAPGAGRAWKRADLVLANSSGMARHLERRGVRAIRAAGGVNVATFRPPAEDERAERAIAGGPIRALIYGRLSRRRKGSLTAAKAVAAAAKRAGVPVELTLFDAPPDSDAPVPAPLPVALPQRWVLHPSQEALAALYGDADLFISAERRAGWCNTAAEAMACGAAVVCTRSGTEDFAVDGSTALVARFPWSWSLAGKAARLMREPALRANLAARGLERIRDFSWERTADVIEAAIGKRLDSGRERWRSGAA